MNLAAAQRYLAAGLCVLPAAREGDAKRVALPGGGKWKPYQSRLPTAEDLKRWFADDPRRDLCLVCGTVSGNLEMIDFDLAGAAFEPWRAQVEAASPGLVERLVIETTPSGGRHVVYRSAEPVCGSLKLAQRRFEAPGPEEIVVCGKRLKPRRNKDGAWYALGTLVETRGEGGVFLCAPSNGYALVAGDLVALPILTAEEREVLLACAWALSEVPEPVEDGPRGKPAAPSHAEALKPGDDFNRRGDVRELLVRHGWTRVSGGDNEHWARPGKTGGCSATLKDGVFYVFSTNAPPFEDQRGYSRFAVYALLEHGGDFAAAARALRAQGYGADAAAGDDVDLSGFGAKPREGDAPPAPGPPDPGPVPPALLRVPGFIGDVIDYTLQNAPYPEPVLAFCGAVALMATLVGRKIRDPQDNRTAIYLLGLANTGTGKDFPRKVNQKILAEAGMPGAFADGFASGEGLEDRMHIQPVMLFQTDEIDALMQAISGHGAKRDPRYEGIMQVLLKLYTSASTIYPLRVKASDPEPRTIDQPCLCLFGTAIPDIFYEALSPKMLSNGFFARMLILEAGRRGSGQDADVRDLPKSIIKRARSWAELPPGPGNLRAEHPAPRVVGLTPEARERLTQVRALADAAYAEAEARSDQAGMALWARANEKARRLALVYACSASHRKPHITREAVDWAWALVDHQTRRMLFKASQHVSAGDFESQCKALVRVLRGWRDKHPSDPWMPYWQISRRLAWSPREHDEVRTALVDQRRIEFSQRGTGGTPQRLYRLIDDGETA
ncbi:MAG: bifunctional DNA primase/polymerase [Phycisphaerales bacterium]